MTPKEKAQELVDKFSNEVLIDNYEAKRCVLIAVDEILSLNCESYQDYKNNPHHYYSKEYWEEVKQEIINL